MNVPQTRVGCGLERAPSTRRSGTGGLVPNNFAAHQETDFGHDDVDVRGKRDVRLPTEVGDVHHHAASRGEHTVAFGEHFVKHREVFFQRKVLIVIFGCVVGGRSDHKMHAIIGKR